MHQDVRGMIRQLRPALLDELGLGDSHNELIDQWQALHPEIDCAVSLDNDLDDLGYILNITLYRIIQEGLTNVAKHAEAKRVLIQLCRRASGVSSSGTLELTIEDNGEGMNPAAPGNGFGLAGMRERTLAAGGEFNVSSPNGTGVRVEVCLPTSKERRER